MEKNIDSRIPRVGVLFVDSFYGVGVSNASKNLVRSLSLIKGVEFVLISGLGARPDFAEDSLKLPIRFIENNRIGSALRGLYLKGLMPIWIWRRISRYVHNLPKALHEAKCDFWLMTSYDFGIDETMGLRYLFHVHDLMHRYEPHFPEVSDHGEFEKRETIYQGIARISDGIICDSELGCKHFHESYNYPENQLFPLPYVVEKIEVPPLAEEIVSQLPEKYFFYPAQFWHHKNHSQILKAVKNLKDQGIEVSCVFVGRAREAYEGVLEEIEALGISDQIKILGFVPYEMIPALYKKARALVMPTFFGPTNLPPLEAQIYGCPVAVSRIYAMPGILADSAIYFDPKSSEELSAVMKSLWLDDDLCAELSLKGFKRAENNHLQSYADQLSKILLSTYTHIQKLIMIIIQAFIVYEYKLHP